METHAEPPLTLSLLAMWLVRMWSAAGQAEAVRLDVLLDDLTAPIVVSWAIARTLKGENAEPVVVRIAAAEYERFRGMNAKAGRMFAQALFEANIARRNESCSEDATHCG